MGGLTESHGAGEIPVRVAHNGGHPVGWYLKGYQKEAGHDGPVALTIDYLGYVEPCQGFGELTLQPQWDLLAKKNPDWRLAHSIPFFGLSLKATKCKTTMLLIPLI